MGIKTITIGIYEVGEPMITVKVPYNSKVRDILTRAKKQLEKDGKLKRVQDVSEWKDQPYLNMDEKISEDHTELFLGEHEPPTKKG